MITTMSMPLSSFLVILFVALVPREIVLTSCQATTEDEQIHAIRHDINDVAQKFSNNRTVIGFGSCHKNLKASKPSIWDTILDNHQDLNAWIWLGDTMYPHKRHKFDYGISPLSQLQEAWAEMKYINATIGYKNFVGQQNPNNNDMIIGGIWDDHDYGGNDMGYQMTNKNERRDLFWDFLGYKKEEEGHDKHRDLKQQPSRWSYDGMYHRIDIDNGKVRVLVLDTRWFRHDHCIPSIAHKIPLGNAIACLSRWLISGLLLHRFSWLWQYDHCQNNTMLGEEQWKWIENELLLHEQRKHDDDSNNKDSPEIFIIASSIQIWSTNPAMEGWGQFPYEQERLWNLLQRHYGISTTPVIFLSGDVHHAEIIGQQGYLEITSSGLTHHCGQPKLYGHLCQPLLESFLNHRYTPKSYYIGINYGTLVIDWISRVVQIRIHNSTGDIVLQVNQSLDGPIPALPSYDDLPHTWDGHMIPYFRRLFWTGVLALIIATRLFRLI